MAGEGTGFKPCIIQIFFFFTGAPPAVGRPPKAELAEGKFGAPVYVSALVPGRRHLGKWPPYAAILENGRLPKIGRENRQLRQLLKVALAYDIGYVAQ